MSRPAEGGGGTGLGMNPALGRQQADTLEDQGKRIKTAKAEIDGLMAELKGVWIGEDQKRFDSKWNSDYSTQLTQAATRLSKAATQVRQDAKQQDSTSA